MAANIIQWLISINLIWNRHCQSNPVWAGWCCFCLAHCFMFLPASCRPVVTQAALSATRAANEISRNCSSHGLLLVESWKLLLELSHLRFYEDTILNRRVKWKVVGGSVTCKDFHEVRLAALLSADQAPGRQPPGPGGGDNARKLPLGHTFTCVRMTNVNTSKRLPSSMLM